MKVRYKHLKKPKKRAPVHNQAVADLAVQNAVAVMNRSRASHVAWIRHFALNPGSEQQFGRLVGTSDQHNRIISDYDDVLELLHSIEQIEEPQPVDNVQMPPMSALDAFSASLADFERGLVFHGGPGSGDFGHAGRPGAVGGSEPGGGAGGHGEHAGHGGHGGLTEMGSHAAHIGHELTHVHDVIHHLAGAVKSALAMVAAKGGAKATVGEGVDHATKALHQHLADHGHEALASGGEESLVGGEHGEHAAGGEHAGGHHLGEFLEATGAILGSKVAGKLEKSKLFGLGKSIHQRTQELTEKMKAEHGAAAPYLHAAATALAIGTKTALVHAIAGPAGSALSGVGEHLAEALGEGVGGFGGFAVPGLTYASLLAAHAFGKALNKSGVTSSTFAKKLGDLHRAAAGTKAVHAAHHAIHAVGEHLENVTGLHLIREGKLAAEHGTAIGRAAGHVAKRAASRAAASGKRLVEALRVRPAEGSAPGYLAANAKEPAFSKDHPGAAMYLRLLKEIVDGLKQSGLWDRLNSAEGARLVQGLAA